MVQLRVFFQCCFLLVWIGFCTIRVCFKEYHTCSNRCWKKAISWTIFNLKFIILKLSRGRLAQWKTVRFVIFRPRGPRFNPRRGQLFRRELLINSQHVWRKIQHRTGSFNLATSTRKAVAHVSTERRGNVPLEIGPMTSYVVRCDVIHTLLRKSTWTLQPGSITSSRT